MTVETIDLYEYFHLPRNSTNRGYLTAYRHGQIAEMGVVRERPAMLVLPGGGYAFVSAREGEPIALQYLQQGFDCFVLDYSIAPENHYPVILEEAGMAMVYLRREADSLNLDAKHIAAVGFSAGGHLCGCISLLWDDPALKKLFPDEYESIRPDASIYSYPVVTTEAGVTHEDSTVNFCGDAAKREDYALETKVRSCASPSFIWATTTDACVPKNNSLRLYSALAEKGVPAELHIFEEGVHGLSTADFETFPSMEDDLQPYKHDRNWLPLSFEFLKAHGFFAKNKEV